MAHFVPPAIQDNPTGWGPTGDPEQFKNMPYQPFSKGDRLGKVSDWTGATYQDKRYMNKYSSQFGNYGQYNPYGYTHEEDESTFQLVDMSRLQRPNYQRGRGRYNQRFRQLRNRQQQQKMEVLTKTQKSRERDRQRQLRKWQKQFGRQMQEQTKKTQVKHRESSVQVKETWVVEAEMDFSQLHKLSLPNVADPEDVKKCGSMEYYNKVYDRVTTKSSQPLKRINRVFHKVTTTDDPVIRKLTKSDANVFATDIILATLMCATRSVYPWDIVVQKIGNKIFFDKREDSEFDLLSVSETATEPPQDEGNSINCPRNLALEATFINHNFSQQVLKMDEEKFEFEEPNPFGVEEEETPIASVGYRYRKWKLGKDVVLVCRCEHDAVTSGPHGEMQFVNIKSLNEWDSRYSGGVDWRSKLDIQKGAVLATEMKNNSFKLAKWTTCAMLAGSDVLKFGYVSRKSPKESARHVILGTQQFKPIEFAQQINLNMDNCWGILRCVVDILREKKDGKYLLMKDPNKGVVRIYDIPNNTFESDDEEEEDDDDDDDDDEDDEDDDEDDFIVGDDVEPGVAYVAEDAKDIS